MCCVSNVNNVFLKSPIWALSSIHCLRCNKQFIGETKRRLQDRFNEHQRLVDRPTPFFQTHGQFHFTVYYLTSIADAIETFVRYLDIIQKYRK